MKRLICATGLLMVAAIVLAMGTYSKTFTTYYKIGKTSTLAKAGCGLCHVSAKAGKLNPYGVDLQKIMKAKKTMKLTPDILKKVEALDSDKDGMKNAVEIKKGRLPGAK